MYIKLNNSATFPCYRFEGTPGNRLLFVTCSVPSSSVSGLIELRADDECDTLLMQTTTAEYPFNRITPLPDGKFQLELFTKEPKPIPEPPEEPEEPAPDPLTDIKLAIAELAEVQAADTISLQLAIAELAEALMGGEA